MGKSGLDRWQIVYNDYSGAEANAVRFLSGELCKSLAREEGVYTLYVIPCVCEKDRDVTKNAIVVGTHAESDLIKKYVKEDEVPDDGWLVKTVKSDVQIIIITAKKAENLYFAATTFTDEFMIKFAPRVGSFTKPSVFLSAKSPKILLLSIRKLRSAARSLGRTR